VLTANPSFYGPGPYFESLQFSIITDASARVEALRSDQVDLVMKVAPPALKRLEREPGLDASTKDSWTVTTMTIRTAQTPTENADVRRAIAYAINRDAIVKSIMLDQANVIDSIMPPGIYGSTEPETKYSYDPDKAKELLKGAGIGDAQIKVVSIPNVYVQGELVAQAVTEQLKDVGFDASLDLVDVGVYVKEITSPEPARHNVFIGEYGWLNGGPFFFSTGEFANYSQFTNSELTRLSEEMTRLPDGDKRLSVLADIQEVVAGEVPLFPICQQKQSSTYRAAIHGFNTPIDGFLPNFGPVFSS
jgi:peptide/nickel transport system substrate-binding protein